MVVVTETLKAPDRESWRAWLEEHADNAREIWLLIARKGTGVASVTYNDAVEEALCFGWIDGQGKRFDDVYFAQRFSPRKPGSVWAESNKARVEKMVREGRMTEAGMALVDEAKRRGTWDDASQARLDEAPPDLEEALAADAHAAEQWAALAPSYRRLYVYWVLDAKRPETRAKRIREVVRRSAAGLRPGEPG